MSKFLSIISLILFFSLMTSCFEDRDDSVDFSVVGTWELTSWTIEVPINLNNDSISSTNLLDEAVCENNETLVFVANGTVSYNMAYNPQVTISLVNGSTDAYIFDVVCDEEGVIGIAGEFTQNNTTVSLFNQIGSFNGNQLTFTYSNAIDIYNESLTEIIDSKDLTLIYTRK